MAAQFSVTFVLFGLMGLFLGLSQIFLIIANYSIELNFWKMISALIFLFAFGYVFFLFHLANSLVTSDDILTSFIFFGGGFFVSLVLFFSRKSMDKLMHVNFLEQENERLAYQAEHDGLTGLFLKNFFCTAVENAIQLSCSGRRFAIYFIDVNDFKIINDTYGHQIGDAALVALSNNLKANLRKDDIIARLGGDEFGALLKLADMKDEVEALKKLTDRISRYSFVYENKNIEVKLAVGFLVLDGTQGNLYDVMCSVDEKCYQAKKSSKMSVLKIA